MLLLFPYGLLSAGTVHDEITDTGAIKRVGAVDLGSLTYSRRQRTADVSDGYKFVSDSSATSLSMKSGLNLTSTLYTAGNVNVAGTNMRVMAGNNLNVSNDAYTDHSVFESAMRGVMLYYELATPITVTFPSPKDLGYNVQSGGTEQLLPSNPVGTGPITAPIIESVNYPLDAVGTLTNLPKNYISVESMDSFTTALGNTLNLNITKTWDSTNNKWTFSVTSRS